MTPLVGGGHGTIVGHVIHETGAAVIINRRHAESLGTPFVHKSNDHFS